MGDEGFLGLCSSLKISQFLPHVSVVQVTLSGLVLMCNKVGSWVALFLFQNIFHNFQHFLNLHSVLESLQGLSPMIFISTACYLY